MVRTDVHSPKSIIPDDYEYVGQECIKVEGLGDCYLLQEMRERIREHMARTGGTYSHHDHGGNCMVCGSVNAIYTVLFHHRPSNVYVRMGSDCADKCAMGGDWANSEFRAAVQNALLAQAGKKKAQAVLVAEGLERCWSFYTSTVSFAGYEEGTINDIVHKLVQYGSVSDAQIRYLHVLLNKIDKRVERKAADEAAKAAAANCPIGRLTVTGTVLGLKGQDTEFGFVMKMLVQHDTGYKVWGTKPSKIEVNKGDRVEFTATVQPSNDDPKFGFFSRPTAARVVTPIAA